MIATDSTETARGVGDVRNYLLETTKSFPAKNLPEIRDTCDVHLEFITISITSR
jgi:hypothetical protein